MTSKSVPASQIVKQAYEALQRGDKQAARHLAQVAVRMAPQMEAPWLILAAVARPRASIAYLERALMINPHSERARKGLEWVHRQLNTQVQPLRRKWGIAGYQAEQPVLSKTAAPKEISSRQVPSRAGSTWRFPHLLLLGLLALCVFAAWVFWPGMNYSASAAMRNLPATVQGNPLFSWMQANLANPTSIPLPTATFTQTVTSSPTPTPNATLPATTSLPPTFTPFPSSSAILLPTITTQPAEATPNLTRDWLLEGEFVIDQFPMGGEKLIVVSIHEQHMYVYQGDTLVFSFVASTGMDNATRAGTYSILDKIPNAYGSTWDIWMPNWLGIYQAAGLENGIHALPFMSNGQRLWAGVLGAPISYGCIVLGVEQSQLLYDWAEVGVTVRIDP
jgi:hypothetical protein